MGILNLIRRKAPRYALMDPETGRYISERNKNLSGPILMTSNEYFAKEFGSFRNIVKERNAIDFYQTKYIIVVN